VANLQQAVDKNITEDANFNDELIEHKFNFNTPEGIPISGMHSEDSAFTKIEALRLYLESNLGIDKLINAH
jgi:hypothetical protein